MSKICGTCQYAKIRKFSEHDKRANTSNEGYCYVEPADLIGIKPKVKLDDPACRRYKERGA